MHGALVREFLSSRNVRASWIVQNLKWFPKDLVQFWHLVWRVKVFLTAQSTNGKSVFGEYLAGGKLRETDTSHRLSGFLYFHVWLED